MEEQKELVRARSLPSNTGKQTHYVSSCLGLKLQSMYDIVVIVVIVTKHIRIQ